MSVPEPPARPAAPGSPLDRLDRRATRLLASASIPVLRLSLGVIFLWFGVLKLVPGPGGARDLAARTVERLTFGFIGRRVAAPVLATWESLIGIGLLSGRHLRATLLLLAVQMAGTLTPLVLFRRETFARFPSTPTLEGQYIIKNLVLIAAAIVVGGTVRGGGLEPEPQPDPSAGQPGA